VNKNIHSEAQAIQDQIKNGFDENESDKVVTNINIFRQGFAATTDVNSKEINDAKFGFKYDEETKT
jgi:hypothetical protein